MISDLTYLILVLFLFYLVYYRIQRNKREGFSNKEGRIVTIYMKRAHDKKLGLMHRKKKLKKNHGLLFDYDRYGVFTFWMKNTYIPLEVICLDHNYHSFCTNAGPFIRRDAVTSRSPAQNR